MPVGNFLGELRIFPRPPNRFGIRALFLTTLEVELGSAQKERMVQFGNASKCLLAKN